MPKLKTIKSVETPQKPPIDLEKLNHFLIIHRFDEVTEANNSGLYKWNYEKATTRELAIQMAARQKEWDLVLWIAQLYNPDGFAKANNYDFVLIKRQLELALLLAVKDNQILVINELVKIKRATGDTACTEINIDNKQGYGALHYAVDNNNLVVAELLINHGFSIHKKFEVNNSQYLSPIELCFANRNKEATKLLIKNCDNFLPLLTNKTYCLSLLVNKIIELSMTQFNATNKTQCTLNDKQLALMQNMLLKQLLNNQYVINRFMFKADKVDQKLIINELGTRLNDLASNFQNALHFEQQSCLLFFHKKNIVLDKNYLIPKNLIDNLVINNFDNFFDDMYKNDPDSPLQFLPSGEIMIQGTVFRSVPRRVAPEKSVVPEIR